MVARSVRNGALRLIPGVRDGGYAAVLGRRTLKEHRVGGIYQWSPPRRSRRPKAINLTLPLARNLLTFKETRITTLGGADV